jgi:predicted dehydrogenase
MRADDPRAASVAPVRAPLGGDHGLRLGLIGFGRLAQQYYVPALRRIPGIAAIAVADPLPASRAAAAGALGGVACFADAAALLAVEPDAVVVATPPSTHLAFWNTLAARGVPVFMEKPFVLRGELARAARGPDVEPLLMIDFNRRFWPPYVRFAELVHAGAVGTLRTIEFTLHVDVASWCTVTAHRLAAGEGGVLYDLGSQALDVACAIAGAEPARIVAHGTSRRWTCDHLYLEAELATGVHVVCDLAYETRTFERVVAVGTGGTLALPDPNMRLHVIRADGPLARARRRVADVATLGYYGVRRGRSMGRASIEAALARFVAAAASGAPFTPGFADAARSTAWLDDAHVEVGP